MTELEVLQDNYEICRHKMARAAQEGDEKSFRIWLWRSSIINRAIDKLMKKGENNERL